MRNKQGFAWWYLPALIIPLFVVLGGILALIPNVASRYSLHPAVYLVIPLVLFLAWAFRDEGVFSPYVCFPVVLLSYYEIGAANFSDFRGWVDNEEVTGYLLLAEAAYFLGVFSSRSLSRPVASSAARWVLNWQPTKVRVVSFTAVAIGLLSVASIIASRGIPFLAGVAGGILGRSAVGGAPLQLAHLTWLGAALYSTADIVEHKTYRRRTLLSLVVFSGLLSTLGYRTYPAMLLLVVAICGLIALGYSTISRESIAHLLVAAVLIIAGLNAFWFLRYSIEAGHSSTSLLQDIGIPSALQPLAPVYLTVREGTTYFYRITQVVGAGDYWGGELFFADLITASPWKAGKLPSGGALVAELLHGTGQAGLAPSLLGGLYLDFGSWGVSSGLFMIGIIAGALYANMQRSRTATGLVLYGYFLAFQLHYLYRGVFGVEYLVAFSFLLCATRFLDRSCLPILGYRKTPRAAFSPLDGDTL